MSMFYFQWRGDQLIAVPIVFHAVNGAPATASPSAPEGPGVFRFRPLPHAQRKVIDYAHVSH